MVSQDIELRQRACAGLMQAGSLVAAWSENICIDQIPLAPPEDLELGRSVVLTQPIARPHEDTEVRDIDSRRQLVAPGGKLERLTGAITQQGRIYE